MKQRVAAFMLCLVMVVGVLGLLPAYAAGGGSVAGQFSALLNPNTDPGDAWRADESNPYGTKKGMPFALTPFSEPIIYSYRNAKKQNLQNASKVYNALTLGKNILESPSGTYSITPVENVTFVVGAAYDPTGTGRMDHAIFVGVCDMDNSAGTARLCYWIQNLVTGKRSDLQRLWTAPKWMCKADKKGDLEYQEFRHYFNVTVGDYDGDGKMTAVVTLAGNDDLWEIGGTGIAGEEGLRRKAIATSKGNAASYFPGWNTDEYEKMQITKALASADLDRDGKDELIVCAGVAEPDKATELSRVTLEKYLTKLTVYKVENGTGKKLTQKTLLSLNREDESESGNRYYDHIRYAGLAAGDIDGDGYAEVVIAGYYREIKEEKKKGYIWESATDGTNLAYAVFYGENLAVSNVSKTSMSSYQANGTKGYGVKPKPAMTCVAINGLGMPEQVFIAGALYEVQKDGSLNLLRDTARIKNSSASYWFYQEVIAGNFDHNTAGREQVIAIAAERQDLPLSPNARKYDLFADVFYGENFNGGSGTFSTAGKYSVTAEADEYSQLSHQTDLAWDVPGSCVLLAGDVNDDGLFARYEGKGFGYSDAQIQAVLQAAPYFSELGDYDLDFSDGETSYTFSSGYSDTNSSSKNMSFGASAVIQGDLKVWRYEATLGYTMDFTQSFEDTLSVEYSASFNAGGDDSVVLYRIPATTYYYSIYDPAKGGFDMSGENIIALMIPGEPVYTMLDREYYNEFAMLYNATYAADITAGKAKALPLLNGGVLPEGTVGNPFAYWTNPGSAGPSVTKFASLSKQKYELGFGASSITSEWTTSTEHAEGVEVANGFAASMKNTWGVDAANAGFAVEFSYSNTNGKVHTTTESKGASGTVNSIDRKSLLSSYGIGYDVSSQYGFNWDFGMRQWSVNGQTIPVFGYVLTNLRAAPPAPELTGVTVEDAKRATVHWQAPESNSKRPFVGYHVWMQKDDGEFERVTEEALDASVLEYVYDGLEADATYTFAVTTQDSSGNASVRSNTKTFSTYTGMDGREVELRNNGSSIQWRYTDEDDSAWRDLVSLAVLTGAAGKDGVDGKQVEMRVEGGYIQWKYTTDTTWNNLVPLSALQGEKGDKGDQGDPGEKGDKGDQGDPGEKGDKGDQGDPGADGVGVAGVTLNEAGELILTFTDGTEKNLGKITGADGKDGKDGLNGKDGKDGVNGKDGADGKDGSNGKDGVSGTDGTNGTDGANGKDGIGIANVSVDDEGVLTVTLTDGSIHAVGSLPVTRSEADGMKTATGVAIGTAGVSLTGILAGVGYSLFRRRRLG